MSDEQSIPLSIPVACPECDAKAGYPYGASTVRGQPNILQLKMRCRTCRHRWMLETEAKP